MDCHSCLQRIFPTQGLNLGLLHCRWILYHLSNRKVCDAVRACINQEVTETQPELPKVLERVISSRYPSIEEITKWTMGSTSTLSLSQFYLFLNVGSFSSISFLPWLEADFLAPSKLTSSHFHHQSQRVASVSTPNSHWLKLITCGSLRLIMGDWPS